MTDDLTIPAFLRRTDRPLTSKPTTDGMSGHKQGWYMPAPSARISAAARDRIASAVIPTVERGADTFGKLRKALGHRYTDRELRAGIRAARGWRTRLRPGTVQGRPVMRRTRVRLVLTGRRYAVIKG